MIIALNNKSNLGKSEFAEYKNKLEKLETNNKLILFPTFLNISDSKLKKIHLGAQNVSISEDGAFTGEISASQLKSYEVEYCIVGHSERRQYQKETNKDIRKKIKNLFSNDITPVLCVGETESERKKGLAEEKIKEEIITATNGLTVKEQERLIIAYEPIWAIGTGIVPTETEIYAVLNLIKKLSPNSPLLYGGSVNENNIDILKKISLIDGFLLGGLSLNLENLAVFLKKCK